MSTWSIGTIHSYHWCTNWDHWRLPSWGADAKREHLELFHNNDYLSEVGIQDLAIEEESQEEVSSAQPIVTTLIIQDHIYEDPMWPIPPPPTLASFIYVPWVHTSKPSLVRIMCQILPYLAKLEGINNQDPYVVLYDTYCGWKPLFDELFSIVKLTTINQAFLGRQPKLSTSFTLLYFNYSSKF